MEKKHWFEYKRVKREMRGFLMFSAFTILAYGTFELEHRKIEGARDFLAIDRCKREKNQVYL